MATELAKAYVQIIPSAKGISGKLKNDLGKEMDNAGDDAGNKLGNSLISKIKKIIVGAGIGKALSSALTEGANLQQSLGGIETLFKDSADKVIENAKNAYKTAGLSANDYMESVTSFSASLLQGLGGDTEKAADIADMALTDMSDNANKMGTSMESIQNAYQGFAKQNYTMLDNLKLGYGGTKTEMERLLADAQKLTGVKYDISNLSDVYSAIHVVQEELGITGTTALEAEKTFSGSMAAMKAAAENVLANLALGNEVGDSLNALCESVITFVNGNLIPMIGNIISSLPDVIENALTLFVRELNILAYNAEAIVKTGIEFISSFVTGIVSAIPYIIDSALFVVTEFGKAILSTDWIHVATETINDLRNSLDIAAGEILGTDGNIVNSLLKAITSQLPSILKKGVEIISNLANGILKNIPEIIKAIGEVLDTFVEFIIDNLPVILDAGIELILSLIDGIIESLPEIVEAASEVVHELLETILDKAPQLIEGGIELIGELIAGIIRAVPKLINEIPGIIRDVKEAFLDFDWLGVGSNILSGIARGISGGASSIVNAAKEAASSALQSAKKFLGIHSPSRVFETQVGKMISLGLAEGIENNKNAVVSSIKDVGKTTLDFAKSDISTFRTVRPNTTVNSGLDGITIVFHQTTELDSKPLMEKTSEYTLRKIGNKYEAQLKARGA